MLVDRDAGAMAEAGAEIRAAVPNAEILEFTADVAEESAARSDRRRDRRAFGRIDVVVNNAGIRSYEPLAEAKAETWQAILSVNLLSYAYSDLRSLAGPADPGAAASSTCPRPMPSIRAPG